MRTSDEDQGKLLHLTSPDCRSETLSQQYRVWEGTMLLRRRAAEEHLIDQLLLASSTPDASL